MRNHSLVITELYSKIKPPKKEPREIFLFKKADIERLKDSISHDLEDLQSIECESASELDDLWVKFKSTILKAVEQYVSQKKIFGRWHVPWLTPLKRVIWKKQRLYCKATPRPWKLDEIQKIQKSNKKKPTTITSPILLDSFPPG